MISLDGQRSLKKRSSLKDLVLHALRRNARRLPAAFDDHAVLGHVAADPPLTTSHEQDESSLEGALAAFNERHPAYALTGALDELRASEYARLDTGETYIDWMGSAVFPQSLVQQHATLLLDPRNVFGNPHSRSERSVSRLRACASADSHSSQRSAAHAADARSAVLRFFDADPADYTVVFTQNATAALKLVGEAYPFTSQNGLVLGVDSHNSVHGIRVFAEKGGASVRYFDCGPRGGVDMRSLRVCPFSMCLRRTAG